MITNDTNENTTKKIVIKEFDDIFFYIGGWGRFQILLTLIFMPFNVFLGYTYLSPILTSYTPPHWCKVPALQNLSVDARKSLAIPNVTKDGITGPSQCLVYDVDWTEVLSNGTLFADPSWPQTSCDSGWEYDYQNYHVSISSELDWVCEEAWIPATAQSLFFFGAIPGCLFFGWFSDQYGRLPTIIITNIICLISGIAAGFVNSYIPFFILRFTMGLGFNTHFTAIYILVMEYVEASKRTFVGNIGLALCLTLSGCYQPWLIKYLQDWRAFNWIIFGQMGLIIFVPWLVPESGRWLMTQGKTEKCLHVIKKIAKINGKKVSDEVYEEFRDMCTMKHSVTSDKLQQTVELVGLEKTKKPATFVDLFRTPHLRKTTILVILLWALTNLVFDGHVRNIQNLDFSIYIAFTLSAFLELPADLLSIPGLNWLGRRWSAAISLALSGIFMIPCAWLQSDWVAVAVMAMIGRFWATYAMNTGFQFTVECMPTQLRGQGSALANTMGMMASMLSPYIVYSSVISPKAPFLILGVLGLLSSVPGLFLPEPAGVNLPDSVEEAEQFGRNDKFFWMPLMGTAHRYKVDKNKQEVALQTAGPENNLAFHVE